MPPTESQLLTSFLLPPAPLPTCLPLQQFTALFPKSIQSSPAITTLYEDLQSQRNEDIALLRKNIAAEANRGANEIKELRRDRRKRDITTTTPPSQTNKSIPQPKREKHNLLTLPTHLTTAQKALEAEITALEEETKEVLEEMRTTVGDLSDLRYGRFQKTPGAETDLRDEVLEALGKVREGAEGVVGERR